MMHHFWEGTVEDTAAPSLVDPPPPLPAALSPSLGEKSCLGRVWKLSRLNLGMGKKWALNGDTDQVLWARVQGSRDQGSGRVPAEEIWDLGCGRRAGSGQRSREKVLLT